MSRDFSLTRGRIGRRQAERVKVRWEAARFYPLEKEYPTLSTSTSRGWALLGRKPFFVGVTNSGTPSDSD